MAKKLLTVLLIFAMLVCILPACSKEEAKAGDTTAAPAEGEPEATEAPTEPVTEAPTEPPTEKETEPPPPPKEYVYETVFKVDFTTMADGAAPFSNPNAIDDLRIEGGLMKGTGTGGDPYMNYNGGDCTFAADSVQEIRIKLLNYSESYDFQFFFTTETVGWSEPASFKYFLDWNGSDGDDNTWNEIVIDTSESTEWVGNITNFRLDPSGAEGDFEFEYVEFLSKTEKAG